MRRGIGQQVLTGLAVLVGVSGTLILGLILAQTDTDTTTSGPTSVADTDVAPTATLLPVHTATPTATSALLEQEASPLTSTPIQAEPPTAVPSSPKDEHCGPPTGWTTYSVKSGENLFRIGLRYGQNVTEMLQANCLTSERVTTGQTLYVPPVTPLPPTATQGEPATSTPDPDATPTLVPGCDDPGAQLTSPAAGTTLTGDIFFSGTADAESFNFYKLEIRPAEGGEYVTFDGTEAPVFNGLLGRVGAYYFSPGQYVVRLAVVDVTSAIVAECSITVTLEGGEPDTTSTDS